LIKAESVDPHNTAFIINHIEMILVQKYVLCIYGNNDNITTVLTKWTHMVRALFSYSCSEINMLLKGHERDAWSLISQKNYDRQTCVLVNPKFCCITCFLFNYLEILILLFQTLDGINKFLTG
jgi:hypothetical protein